MSAQTIPVLSLDDQIAAVRALAFAVVDGNLDQRDPEQGGMIGTVLTVLCPSDDPLHVADGFAELLGRASVIRQWDVFGVGSPLEAECARDDFDYICRSLVTGRHRAVYSLVGTDYPRTAEVISLLDAMRGRR